MSIPHDPRDRASRRRRYYDDGYDDEVSARELLREITQDIQDIVRLEVKLARAELQEGLIAARQAAVLFGIAAGLGFLGAILLPFAAAWALGLVLPMWAAALIVAAALLIVGGVFAYAGKRRLDTAKLRPERTIATLQEFNDTRRIAMSRPPREGSWH